MAYITDIFMISVLGNFYNLTNLRYTPKEDLFAFALQLFTWLSFFLYIGPSVNSIERIKNFMISLLTDVLSRGTLGHSSCSAILVDIMPEWRKTFQLMIGKLRLENCTYGILSRSVSRRNFDWAFIGANLQEEMSQDINVAIGSANLITMVKFVSAVACKKTSEMVEKIFEIMQPGAMVLFIDNAGGGFQELITSAAQKHHLVPIFGPLNHELYVNETLNQEKFGYKSCHKTRVALQLLMKIDPVQYSTGVRLSSQLYPSSTTYPQRRLLPHFYQYRNTRPEILGPVPFHYNMHNSDPRQIIAYKKRHSLNLRGYPERHPLYYPFFYN